MAKAPVENSTFISLRGARAALAEAWQCPLSLAERDLRNAWARGQVHSRAGRVHGHWHREAPAPTGAKLIVTLRQNAKTVRINWEESSARLACDYGVVTFYRVEFYREHIDKLLAGAWGERAAVGAEESAPQPDASRESEPPLDGKLGVTVRAIDALVDRGVAFDASGEEARLITIEIEARKIAADPKLKLSARIAR